MADSGRFVKRLKRLKAFRDDVGRTRSPKNRTVRLKRMSSEMNRWRGDPCCRRKIRPVEKRAVRDQRWCNQLCREHRAIPLPDTTVEFRLVRLIVIRV